MANDGGVIIYGIGEDADKRPVVLNPIELAGVPERISAIVRSSIAEPPTINITTIRTKKDQSKGYLVVSVPASPRAPHMVIVGKDYRYYGRSATGNTPLTEGEVSRLYERRKRWEHDFDELLDQVINHAPLQPSNEHGFLHLIAKPLIYDDGLLDRASQDSDIRILFRELVRNARSKDVLDVQFSPDFQEHSWRRKTDGWGSYMGWAPEGNSQRDPEDVLDVDINFDGTAYLFCGRAAERMEGGLFIIEVIVAGLTARFLSMMGILYIAFGLSEIE